MLTVPKFLRPTYRLQYLQKVVPVLQILRIDFYLLRPMLFEGFRICFQRAQVEVKACVVSNSALFLYVLRDVEYSGHF